MPKPNWKAYVRAQLPPLALQAEREAEVIEELALHLEEVYEAALAAGTTEAEAQAQAAALIKDWRWLECEVRRAKQTQTEAWLTESLVDQPRRRTFTMKLDEFKQNLRYALRTLGKQPGFTAVIVLTLALGIGASTAIFSVVNAALFRSLPGLDETRLVTLESGNQQKGAASFGGVSPADYQDWQAQSQSFSALVAYRGNAFQLTGVAAPELFPGALVTTNFFQLATTPPLLGCTFRAEDGAVKAPPVIVLSYRLWQSRFGSDPQIVGKTLGDTGTQVIGVMPAEFKYPFFAECWQPIGGNAGEMTLRGERYFSAVGLLKPGVTQAQAQAEMEAIAGRLAVAYPKSNKAIAVQLSPFRQRMARDVRLALLILLGAISCVLLIACANVAALLLTRASERRKEMAIRLALGATRWQLMRQLLTESLLLALTGASLGLLFSFWLKDALVALLPASYDYLLLKDQVRLDGRVLLFTLGLALVNGSLFGWLPAWQAARSDVNECLKAGGRALGAAGGQRARSFLVVTEIALALLLLTSAGLLLRSFIALRNVEPGFNPEGLSAASLSISPQKYPDKLAQARFIQQMQQSLAAVPGVESVAVSSGNALPYLNFTFNLPQRPLPNDEAALYETISPNYFRTLQTRLLAGREFTEADQATAPRVAIINQTLARQFFAGADPLGQLLTLNYLGGRPQLEIVGVAQDATQGDLGKVKPQIYVPYQQQPWFGAGLLVRSTIAPETLKPALQQALLRVDPQQGVMRLDVPTKTLAAGLTEPRLYTLLLGAFAALALLLALLGTYGVLTYSVAQRQQEIGIRLALGAPAANVLRLVIAQGMKLVLLGTVVGLAAALGLTQLLKSILYGVSTTDPLTFAGTALLLIAVALLACWLPARRAAQVDPLVVLRGE